MDIGDRFRSFLDDEILLTSCLASGNLEPFLQRMKEKWANPLKQIEVLRVLYKNREILEPLQEYEREISPYFEWIDQYQLLRTNIMGDATTLDNDGMIQLLEFFETKTKVSEKQMLSKDNSFLGKISSALFFWEINEDDGFKNDRQVFMQKYLKLLQSRAALEASRARKAEFSAQMSGRTKDSILIVLRGKYPEGIRSALNQFLTMYTTERERLEYIRILQELERDASITPLARSILQTFITSLRRDLVNRRERDGESKWGLTSTSGLQLRL